MTDVNHLFTGHVEGKVAKLTLQLDQANTTTNFDSADEIGLGNADQSIEISLADAADYVISGITARDPNVLSVSHTSTTATIALKTTPTQPLPKTEWSMTLFKEVNGVPILTITIDPTVDPDPDRFPDAPEILKLNGPG